MSDIARPEDTVVGSMLIDPDIVPDVLAAVNPEDFSNELNRGLFEAMRRLFLRGSRIDAVLALNELGRSEDKTAREYTAQLMELTPTSANWPEYAAAMHEHALLLRIHGVASDLYDAPTLDACREPAARLAALIAGRPSLRGQSLSELLIAFAERQGTQGKKQFITTGLSELDGRTFLDGGDVLMIGGLPSDGKTAFALTIALHMAKTHKVGFFSLETSNEKLTDRIVSSGWQLDFDRIKAQTLVDADWVVFANRMPEYSERKLWLFEESSLTVDQIAAISGAYGFEVIFIDYVQLVETRHERGGNRATELAEVSRALKMWARSSRTLTVELAQRKQPDTRSKKLKKNEDGELEEDENDGRANMFDLGESSAFTKDADVIFQLMRPRRTDHVAGPDSPYMNHDRTRILRVAKNKEGRTGIVKLAFDGKHQCFYILGQEPEARRPSDRKKPKQTRPTGQICFAEQADSEEEMPF